MLYSFYGSADYDLDLDYAASDGDIRRIAVIHSAVAFFYNLVVLAFTINVTAGS